MPAKSNITVFSAMAVLILFGPILHAEDGMMSDGPVTPRKAGQKTAPTVNVPVAKVEAPKKPEAPAKPQCAKNEEEMMKIPDLVASKYNPFVTWTETYGLADVKPQAPSMLVTTGVIAKLRGYPGGPVEFYVCIDGKGKDPYIMLYNHRLPFVDGNNKKIKITDPVTKESGIFIAQ